MELGNRSFGKFKLAAAAQCPAFGIRRYKALTGRSFLRCCLCDRVFKTKHAASKHSCGRQERAEACAQASTAAVISGSRAPARRPSVECPPACSGLFPRAQCICFLMPA